MTWEQRWMRRLIKAALWCAVFFSLTWALEIKVTYQIIGLVVVCGWVQIVLDEVFPTTDGEGR